MITEHHHGSAHLNLPGLTARQLLAVVRITHAHLHAWQWHARSCESLRTLATVQSDKGAGFGLAVYLHQTWNRERRSAAF
ncbi:hypothetical protein D3C73_1446160 [compost metagenome]